MSLERQPPNHGPNYERHEHLFDWRAHVKLDFVDKDVIIHPAFIQNIEELLKDLEPLVLFGQEYMTISFNIPDETDASLENAKQLLEEIIATSPRSEVAWAKIHDPTAIDRDE